MIAVMRAVANLLCPWPILLGVVLLTLGGCGSVPTREQVPAPSLRLLESAPLTLAEDCRPSGTVAVEFTVLETGRPDQIRTLATEPCVRQALTAWVGSFRYAPPPARTPAAIEWMLVTARRGS